MSNLQVNNLDRTNFDDLTILVNSSDGFEDCWYPFFSLLKKNWTSVCPPILLNTEFKDYSFDGLDIKTSKANLNNNNRRLTWSECLIEALHKINTPLVLYLQEDYFIEQPVLTKTIDDFAGIMTANLEIKYIGLTHFGNYPPFRQYSQDDRLWVVGRSSRYRISTQAGIWRKETLLSYLKGDENGWMFEIFGTQRAKRRNELFLTANRERFHSHNKSGIIDYLHTGIIKGQWHPQIPALFEKNGLDVDFDLRGFYKEKPYLFRKFETGKKLFKDPIKFLRKMKGN